MLVYEKAFNGSGLFCFRFDPERFSPDQVKNRDSLAFVPFGFAGKRKCPGYRFSYFEATVLLVKLLKNFKVELVEGTKVTAVHQLVTHATDFWVTCERRD